ncbi:GntR family transcriptional regulator [Streptosporangium sp. NBC_01639]|uniref:GntR family transcriptional regulator n=1 Tax=unclassified Streptosporangium TaxID=2632669 RepID=UPI002DD978AE|nr:GntR family transcriptional regulator [Streptosporangium sp. NBC_01756]WSC90352.1 GntR family transcriptional regulator [Streptosporangium sp. NBC_01756]WTD58759.1 GntR family transcriptional regulator [Streptosporangium sp. NBC_01639]
MTSNPSGPVTAKLPKYLQIKESLLADYVEGQPAGHMLPPERILAQDFGVTRVTLRRAIDELESDGLVYRVQGGGTFCVGPAIAKSLKLTSFSEDIRARGRKPSSVVLEVGIAPAGEEAGRNLRLSPGEPILLLRRLRRADGEPMCLEACALPAESVPGLQDMDLTGSLYELVGREFGLYPSWAEQRVEATVLAPDDAKLLGVPSFSAALRATRVSYDTRGKAVEYCVTTYRADRYALQFAVRRD